MNTYLKSYCELIRSAEQKPSEKPFERHHVFPKCIYGDNKRIVFLSPLDHVIAHELLWKAFEVRYGKRHRKTMQMATAYFRTIGGKSNEHAALAKIALAESRQGEGNPAYGKPGTFAGRKHTQHSKDLIKADRLNNSERTKMNASLGAKVLWSKMTDEEKFNLHRAGGLATKGISKGVGLLWWTNGKEEIKSKDCPKDWTSGRLKQSSISNERKKQSASKEPKVKISCPHCNKVGGKPVMKRFHFDACKLRLT